MKGRILILSFCLFIFSQTLYALETWEAKWISYPNLQPKAYAVLHFRNTFNLDEIPGNQKIHISADIRYKLYINGEYLAQGPANNSLKHYVYDTHEISKSLKQGENIIAVTVFSFGDLNPLRFESSGAKLIVQADNNLGNILNTGSGKWKVFKNEAYSPTRRNQDFEVLSYFAMGGGEKIDASRYPWNWEATDFNDQEWLPTEIFNVGEKYGNNLNHGGADISLSERKIPFMDEGPEQKPKLRPLTTPLPKEYLENWNNNKPLVIPANSEISLILDQTYLCKGHPFFEFSGGKGAEVKISYAETFFIDVNTKDQGHRDTIEGKSFIGLADKYILDGGKKREFSTLLQRVWRFIKVDIKTATEPLEWNSYKATRFIYPFKKSAFFKSENPLHEKIWNTGWRTALLCTDETYMDCPYYEQLQYIGDTRIQAFISLYLSGDDRLMKNSISQFAHSITDEGITQSRFPSSSLQYIPPFSLFWINMVHDYHMHRDDDAFTARFLNQIASVLFWFENKLGDDYLLGPIPWWPYVDVVKDWQRASPPGSREGGSVVLTLQYVYALQDAISLFEYHQKDSLSRYFTELKSKIQQSVLESGYCRDKYIFSDTPEKKYFSQHANIMAILTDTAPAEDQSRIFKNITEDTAVAQTNLYFTFYLIRAAQKSGNGDFFLKNLKSWEQMLAKGLTTFSETRENTRSDCHAWSASPNYEYINTVLGIQPAAPHFKKVKIEPNPGCLKEISGKMPHPNGEISVKYTLKNSKLSGEIILPEGIEGTFHWQGKQLALKAGKNVIKL